MIDSPLLVSLSSRAMVLQRLDSSLPPAETMRTTRLGIGSAQRVSLQTTSSSLHMERIHVKSLSRMGSQPRSCQIGMTGRTAPRTCF